LRSVCTIGLVFIALFESNRLLCLEILRGLWHRMRVLGRWGMIGMDNIEGWKNNVRLNVKGGHTWTRGAV